MSSRRMLAASVCCLLYWGCGKPPTPPAEGPPTVEVATPLVRDVVDSVEFTGRTAAPFALEVKARVTGYLTKMPFKEGSEVKTGDLLFEVDPRPYQAAYDRAFGDVGLQKAKLKLAIADNNRAKSIFKMNPGAISQQDLDKYQASEDEAKAAVDASIANLETYKINLDFCQVTSPIDGRISRYFFTLGNLVNQDQTLLTTVVSQDPMYAYFDVDERTMLRVERAIQSGKIASLKSRQAPVQMGLNDEKGFPHTGYVDFANNTVDAQTGTITLRGVFANPPVGPDKLRLLKPGMFVRVRLPLGRPAPAVLVVDRAVCSDQGAKYLLLLGPKDQVEYRRVELGALQDDGLRVIAKGLAADEKARVIISGLQFVQPGITAIPKLVPMPVPVPGAATTSSAPADSGPESQPASAPAAP